MPCKEIRKGEWTGRWLAKPMVNGKRRYLHNPDTGTTQFETRTDAIKAEIAYREAQAKVRGPMTVREFYESWEQRFPANRRDTTWALYLERCKLFVSEYGDRPMNTIDRVTARGWAIENRSRARKVAIMFADAYNDGIVDSNPFRSLGLNVDNRRAAIILTEPQFEHVAATIERVHGPEFGTRLAAMFRFAGYSALRPGELFELRRSDIDTANNRITVEWQRNKLNQRTRPKNGQTRVVALLPQALEALAVLPPRIDGLLFSSLAGAPMNHSSLSAHWRTIPEAAGLPGLRWYEATKHYAGSQMALRGLPPILIARQLGHTDKGETALRHYVHLYDDEALDVITRAFARPVGLDAYRKVSTLDGPQDGEVSAS